jgi:precorrin-6B methylase 2
MLKRSAEEMAGPLEEGAAAGSIATELAAAAPTSVVMSAEVEELRAQLEQLQGELKASRAESHSLREEADFYIRKLERIEEACVDTTQPHAEVISTVVRLLHAEA